MQRFEFAILGAGAMGSILGAHLARAGHSVALLARGRRAEQVRSEGLRISGLTQFSTPTEAPALGGLLRRPGHRLGPDKLSDGEIGLIADYLRHLASRTPG